jgi:hypothetical protein
MHPRRFGDRGEHENKHMTGLEEDTTHMIGLTLHPSLTYSKINTLIGIVSRDFTVLFLFNWKDIKFLIGLGQVFKKIY